MASLWSRLPKRVDPTDLVALISVVLLTIGVALIFIPAAFIVAGLLGLLYAIAVSRTEVKP